MARDDSVRVSDDLLLRFPPVCDVKNNKPIAALEVDTDALG